MKKHLLFSLLCCGAHLASGQILLETVNGSQISLNPTGLKSNIIVGNVNTTDQSIQFRGLLALSDPSGKPKRYLELGIRGKPSDGIATLFSKGNFNSSTLINLSFTKVNLFSSIGTGFTDFYSIRAEYGVQEYTLFNPDNSFNEQVNNFNFQGGGASFNYNLLIDGKGMFSFFVGYLYNSNYSKLKSVEIRDFTVISDSVSNTYREYGKVINGRTGNYKEFESFPMRLAYTYCPSEFIQDTSKLTVGFSIYLASEFGKFRPIHNLGALVFLTKQDKKTGVRAPIFGVGIQFNDLNDNANTGSTLGKRLTFSISTTFNLTALKL